MTKITVNSNSKVQLESGLFDDDAFGVARSEFFENRERFVERLLCAQYFDADRFEATISWLERLERFHAANAEPMCKSYFKDFETISNHLDIQSRYSTTQKEVCAAALSKWSKIVDSLGAKS